MEYRIAIPSYHRHERIGQATLPLLAGAKVDMERVTVFLTDEQEQNRYRPVLRKYGVRAEVGHGLGTAAAHNHIANFYPTATPLVQIDDDVTRFARRVDEKTTADVEDLPAIIQEGFAAAGDTLWCIYPVLNPYFMRPRVRGGLLYALGSFFAYVVQNKPHELCTVDHGDDYERSIRFFEARGAITRLDYYAVQSRYWKEPGGLQDIRTPANIEAGLRYITDKWPHLTRMKYNAAGQPNLRLVMPKA